MSKSFEGDLPGIHGRPSSAGTERSPHHNLLDPRRAMSPGPDFYSNKVQLQLDRRAVSPGPELLKANPGLTGGMALPGTGLPQYRTRNSHGRTGSVPTPVAMPTVPDLQQQRTDYVRSSQVHIVNPTKLQGCDPQNRPQS
jgi:hypothetical protein